MKVRKTVAPAASDSGRQVPVNTLDEGGVTFEGGDDSKDRQKQIIEEVDIYRQEQR